MESDPVGLVMAEHNHGVAAGNEKRAGPCISGRSTYGMEPCVRFARLRRMLDHHSDLVLPLEFVAHRSGSTERRLFVVVSEQFLDKVPTQPQLGIGHTLQAGQLHGENRGTVLERNLSEFEGLWCYTYEHNCAEDVRAGAGHRNQLVADRNGSSGFGRPPHHLSLHRC
jgi:hypothetical protein